MIPPFDETVPVIEGAVRRWEGEEVHGTDWSAAFLGPQVVIGQPDFERVVVVEAEDELDQPRATFAGVDSDFGTALHIQPSGDLWVGAPGDLRSRGGVYVFRDAMGDEGREAAAADLIIEGMVVPERFGSLLLGCPDYTGDGIGEVLVGVPAAGVGDASPLPIPSLAGAVVLLESERVEMATGRVSALGLGRVWWGDGVGRAAGTSVACDAHYIYVGAPWVPDTPGINGGPLRGRVYALDPRADNGALDERAARVVEGAAPDGWFGASLATLEWEGESALAVGEPGFGGAVGRVSVLDTPSLVVRARFGADPTHGFRDHLGRTLYRSDVDGDGVDDLLVGSPDHRRGPDLYDVGALWGFLGARRDGWSMDGTTAAADFQVQGGQAFMRIGRAVAVGDPDGDGQDELLIPTRAPTRSTQETRCASFPENC